MLADLADLGEPVVREQFGSTAKEEPSVGFSAIGYLRYCFHQSAAPFGNLSEGTLDSCSSNAFAPVAAIDEDTRNPPIGQRGRVLVVRPAVFDVGELLDVAVLGPTLRDTGVIEYQRMMSAAAANPLLLDGAVVDVRPPTLRVIPNTPAAPVDAVVAFDQLREEIPSHCIEFGDLVPRRSRFLVGCFAHGVLIPVQWHVLPHSAIQRPASKHYPADLEPTYSFSAVRILAHFIPGGGTT